MSLFTIKKGKHYCSPRLGLFGLKPFDYTKGGMSGTFVLNKNMWYDPVVYGSHINKLCGYSTDIFSDGSLRLGWRPAEEIWMFEIYAYLHIGGEWVRSHPLKNDLINVCYPDQLYAWDIPTPVNQIARLSVGANTVERYYPMALGRGWVQEFYYGGKPTSPQFMSVEISGREYEL